MISVRSLILLIIIMIGGCTDDQDVDLPDEIPVDSLPGVYSGVFPCADCPGIPTTLWVRADGRFFIEQEYPESDGREEVVVHNLGRWNWFTEDQVLVLQGAGPSRAFTRPDADALIMRTESDLEHRLGRDPAAPDFSAAIRMKGVVQLTADGAFFEECLSGLVAPVSRHGDYSRFVHQYRSVAGRGEQTHVELDGRFSWSDDGTLRSLTIVRFVTIRSDGSC